MVEETCSCGASIRASGAYEMNRVAEFREAHKFCLARAQIHGTTTPLRKMELHAELFDDPPSEPSP